MEEIINEPNMRIEKTGSKYTLYADLRKIEEESLQVWGHNPELKASFGARRSMGHQAYPKGVDPLTNRIMIQANSLDRVLSDFHNLKRSYGLGN